MNISNKLLEQINQTREISGFSLEQLQQLSHELRNETISTVSSTGGHLGASLGVIELTVALHHVFNTPHDLLIWDVGHQSLPHKILTDRRHMISTYRQAGGISCFTKRLESIFDPFGAGHSSTSISAALGMAVARDLLNDKREVIAVIGDGAMSAGMAYEAMNNAGFLRNRLIVILNDNDMSISPAVGALNAYLSRLISSKQYLTFRRLLKKVTSKLPKLFQKLLKKTERNAKDWMVNGNFFEEMGFYYLGPIDGHNLSHLLPVLKNIRDDDTINRPVLIHVITEKGKGFNSPEPCQEKFHAVSKFDPETLQQSKYNSSIPTYTKVFSDALIRHAELDDKVIAITAAMPSGTGLDSFSKKFPSRFFDVGIAEQHAVTFAAGLSCSGMKPVVAIYSTFLQRAYDQVIHDVAIQSLPVRFAIDRAGYVGADGPTHAGSFDIMYLASLPNFVVMAPSDEAELVHMLATAISINDRPSSVRYPRGTAIGAELPQNGAIIPIGKGRVVKEGYKVVILSLGTRLDAALKTAEILKTEGIDITVADARFAKPLDEELITNLAQEHEWFITLEEGSIGGFGSHVLDLLTSRNLLDSQLKVRTLHYPDRFLEQDSVENMHKEVGLEAEQIAKYITNLVKSSDPIAKLKQLMLGG